MVVLLTLRANDEKSITLAPAFYPDYQFSISPVIQKMRMAQATASLGHPHALGVQAFILQLADDKLGRCQCACGLSDSKFFQEKCSSARDNAH
jgi:hypothetical protein